MRSLALIGLVASGASATEHNVPPSHDLVCNENGYVLTLREGRFAGRPLYLGNACDAFHAPSGDGNWCWGNGSVSVEFSGQAYSFSGMELACETRASAAPSGSGCGCHTDPLPSWRQ
ncbi:hypothetical protein ACFQ4E_13215 [Litorisediminicola beolgyonensis]|uniref:Uncharacterized protein n=1 Tax=Litorisediminicola beolgyonensis TaxID=1173614 RepID=A0ABW3ZKS1_9RHOB